MTGQSLRAGEIIIYANTMKSMQKEKLQAIIRWIPVAAFWGSLLFLIWALLK